LAYLIHLRALEREQEKAMIVDFRTHPHISAHLSDSSAEEGSLIIDKMSKFASPHFIEVLKASRNVGVSVFYTNQSLRTWIIPSWDYLRCSGITPPGPEGSNGRWSVYVPWGCLAFLIRSHFDNKIQ